MSSAPHTSSAPGIAGLCQLHLDACCVFRPQPLSLSVLNTKQAAFTALLPVVAGFQHENSP